jgi:epoxide hydrolase-like predicted phosphatase
MIKHIVFDFGGVFLDLDGVATGYPRILATIFNLPLEQVQPIWADHKILITTGQESPAEFLARMKQVLGLDFNVAEGLAFWEKSNLISRERIDWDLVEILKELKQAYQVHMLSDQIKLNNGAADWLPAEVESHFETLLRSHEQGFRKPDLAAFKNLLAKIQAEENPSSVVFIDDLPQNIEAAEKLGIKGILYTFKNHDLLRNELKKFGVKISG